MGGAFALYWPVTIEQGGIRYAPGMKAGRWIFATGHKGNADFASGMSADVMREALPSWDSSKHRRESDQIFANLGRVLQAGGSRFGNIVRVDQYYTDYRAVPPYHGARRAALGDHIPPSTSILMPRLLLAGQDIEMQMIAVEDGVKVQHIRPKAHAIHASSGYSLALTAGDFVFVAGRLADALVLTDGLAPEVRLPAGHLWKGVPVKLEAEYTIKQKLEPALKAAGSSLADIVKCQVYLRDPADFAPFNEVWREFFPKKPPATSVMPMATPGLAIEEGRIEINAIALRSGGKTRARTVDAKVMPAWAGYSQAVQPAIYCLFQGCWRSTATGSSMPRASIPRSRCSARACRRKWTICSAMRRSSVQRPAPRSPTSCASSSFIPISKSSIRLIRYGSSICRDSICPYSAVEVPFLPVPGCTVQLDLWVYAPWKKVDC